MYLYIKPSPISQEDLPFLESLHKQVTRLSFSQPEMSLPTTRRGLFKTAQFKTLITDQPFPKLRDNHILIKTVAVALNPADWQTVEESFTPGTPPALLGCDISGIVVAIGKGVTKSWNIGDRVASCVHGG